MTLWLYPPPQRPAWGSAWGHLVLALFPSLLASPGAVEFAVSPVLCTPFQGCTPVPASMLQHGEHAAHCPADPFFPEATDFFGHHHMEREEVSFPWVPLRDKPRSLPLSWHALGSCASVAEGPSQVSPSPLSRCEISHLGTVSPPASCRAWALRSRVPPDAAGCSFSFAPQELQRGLGPAPCCMASLVPVPIHPSFHPSIHPSAHPPVHPFCHCSSTLAAAHTRCGPPQTQLLLQALTAGSRKRFRHLKHCGSPMSLCLCRSVWRLRQAHSFLLG